MRNLFRTAITLAGLLVLAGCASTYTVRTQEDLLTENPVNRVAVVAEGTVIWHGLKRDVYDPSEARTALDLLTLQAAQYLTVSGYEVVFSAPLRVTGSRDPEGYLLCEDYVRNKTECSTMPPGALAYTYPLEGGIAAPAARLFDAIGNIPSQDLRSHVPDASDVAALTEATGADTVCLLRFRDVRNTKGATIAALFTEDIPQEMVVEFFPYSLVVVAPVAVVADAVTDAPLAADQGGLILFCSDARGRVLWQDHSFPYLDEPEDPSREALRACLRYFPDAGHPLDASCKPRGEDIPDLWRCERPPRYFRGEVTVLMLLSFSALLL